MSEEHRTKELKNLIIKRIKDKGALNFAEYTELALYTPNLGYYNCPRVPLGKEGDFITAPEWSSLFSYCLSNQCAEIIEKLQYKNKEIGILEIGAGTGILARDLLKFLSAKNKLPDKYIIYEYSDYLKKIQQERIRESLPLELANKFIWLNDLRELKDFVGIIIANEWLDAIPVHLFSCYNNGKNLEFKERLVSYKNDNFIWQEEEINNPKLYNELLNISKTWDLYKWPLIYKSEINLDIEKWLKILADVCSEAICLLFDYGYPREEYYHPQRVNGTLICHYNHSSNDNPFLFPGRQDITSFVDFTMVAEKAHYSKWQLLGYTNQANFLLQLGILETYKNQNKNNFIDYKAAINQLIAPQIMGEKFKVLAMGINYTYKVSSFSDINQIEKL